MSNQAERTTESSPEDQKWANLLRATILAIPETQRNMAFEQVRDLLPPTVTVKSPAPQRGGPLLNNIYELFKSDPNARHAAADVVAELGKRGGEAAPKPAVRYALNYLEDRRVLRRVGYGLYQLANGEIVSGNP